MKKSEWREKEWAEFGRSIYDASQKLFADRPIVEAVIPFKDDDGFLCRAIIRDIPTFTECYTDKDGNRKWRNFHKKSDGTLVEIK